MAQQPLLEFERAVSATLVREVCISPDGAWVAFVASPASKEAEQRVSSIWLVNAEGGAPRRLTTSEMEDSAPRWSPDSRRLAFTSDRLKSGVAQLYVLTLDGGEAVRLTDHAGGIADPAWSPDGHLLAYTAKAAVTDAEKQRQETRHDAKVIDADVKSSSLWVLSVPEDAAHVAGGGLPDARQISPADRHVGGELAGGYAWAPDSAGFVALLSPGPKSDYLWNPELVTLDMAGTVHSLGHFEGLLKRPIYSPNGTTIAFGAAEDAMPAFFSLHVIPATGGAAQPVMPDYAGSFYDFAWLPDGERLIVVCEEGQSHRLVIVDPETHTLSDAIASFEQPGAIDSWDGAVVSASADGRRLAFKRSDDYSFGEVYVADVGGAPRCLTDLNPWVREYTFGETRELTWTSFDGADIQGLLILPVGYAAGQRYPLLTDIHGGPMGAYAHTLYAGGHAWGQFLAQRGYAVLLPNPRGSSGRGTAFLSAITDCYGEPDWQDIMAGVDHLIEEGIADPEQLVVGGWSGGGYLTNVSITHTDRFKAAVSGAGIANWVSFQGTSDIRGVFDRYLGHIDQDPETAWRLSPIRVIGNATTPTLILYGEQDVRVPISQGYELYEGLKSRGVEAQFVLYPRQPHGIEERNHQIDVLTRMVEWYERHLGRLDAQTS